MTMVEPPGNRLYRLRTQLTTGLRTEGEDCGPLGVVNVIRQMSDGRVGPKYERDVPGWVKAVRRWARRPTGAFMVLGDTYQALAHPELADRFKRNGLKPLRPDYEYGTPWETVIARLRRHHGVLIAVDYGGINVSQAPSGSPTFNGSHIMLFLEAENHDGKIWTLDGDPLFDGRRPGIPEGWQDARLVDFKVGAGAFGTPRVGYGRAVSITIPRVA